MKHRMARLFDLKYHLGGQVSNDLMLGEYGFFLVRRCSLSAASLLLKTLGVYARLVRPLFGGTPRFDRVTHSIKLLQWLDADEPFNEVLPIVEKMTLIDRPLAAESIMHHLLFKGRYNEARTANQLWCEAVEELALHVDQDLRTELTRVNSTEHGKHLALKAPPRSMTQGTWKEFWSVMNDKRPRIRPIGYQYRNARLSHAFLEWAQQHDDVPLEHLVTHINPQHHPWLYHSHSYGLASAKSLGISKKEYSVILGQITGRANTIKSAYHEECKKQRDSNQGLLP